jgi:choline dehydrogenase-like flavoprotein
VGSDRSSDVVIIGAGAAGSVAAKHLAERGFDVTCLEQGDWVDPSSYPGPRPEYELLAQKDWHPNPNVRGGDADYPCETSDSTVNPLMFSGVGGSTILWGSQWLRFAPSDFRVRSLDGVADDWPLTYEDLVPYYERVEADMAVSGLGGDPAYPAGNPPPLPPHPIGAIGRKAAEGMNRLGWHWWPATLAIPPSSYRGMSGCTRRAVCITGCPDRAKASMDITHWPDAMRHGARLITGARVSEISVSDRGLATGVTYVDRDGKEHQEKAAVVVLCANGVGTPRVLLLSESSRFPDGLANSSGLVGRRLMMHPIASVIGVYEDELESWVGTTGAALQSMQFYETDDSLDFVRGCKWQAMPTGGPLGGVRGGHAGMETDDQWGENFHRRLTLEFGHTLEWSAIAEDLPEETNFVGLDPEVTDSDGIPAPRIVYETSENSRSMLRFHVSRMIEAHEAAGAIKTTVAPAVRDCGWHLMGTTKMGSDPESSVVDAYGRAHDVPNLYVCDGSVFPTSSGVNPTATICAFALRCAEHIASSARVQEVAV